MAKEPSCSLSTIHQSAWKKDSRKFTVTSGASIVGLIIAEISDKAPPAPIKILFATFVAKDRYNSLRLATVTEIAWEFRRGLDLGSSSFGSSSGANYY